MTVPLGHSPGARPSGSLRLLLRGGLFYTIGNAIPRALGLLLLPIYLHLLEPAQYGIVALVLSVTNLLRIVYRLGLDGALMRLHLDADANVKDLYYTVLWIVMGASLIFSVAFVAVGVVVFPAAFGLSFWPFGLLAGGISVCAAAQFLPLIWFRARNESGRFLLFSTGTLVLTSVIAVAFVARWPTPEAVLIGQLVAAALILAALVAWFGRQGSWKPSLGRSALALGLPLVPHAGAAWLLQLSDRWMLSLLLPMSREETLRQIGVYSAGYQLGFVVAIVALSVNAAWVPTFYQLGDRPAGPTILKMLATLTTALLCFLTVALGSYSGELLFVMGGDRAYVGATSIIVLVGFASVAQGLYTVFVAALFLQKRVRVIPIATLAAASFNIAVNLVTIPRLGITGAALATLLGYIILAAVTYFVARRMYRVEVDWIRIAVMTGAAMAVTGVALAAPAFSLASIAMRTALLIAYAVLVVVIAGGAWRGMQLAMRKAEEIAA